MATTYINRAKQILRLPYHYVFSADPEDNKCINATILEFVGCYASGKTMEEATKNLQEAAKVWVAECLKQGQRIPSPVKNLTETRKRLYPHVYNHVDLDIVHYPGNDSYVFVREHGGSMSDVGIWFRRDKITTKQMKLYLVNMFAAIHTQVHFFYPCGRRVNTHVTPDKHLKSLIKMSVGVNKKLNPATRKQVEKALQEGKKNKEEFHESRFSGNFVLNAIGDQEAQVPNMAKCTKCGDIIHSKTVHDFQTCKCGAISVDGGHDYCRRIGNPEDFDPTFDHRNQ